MREWFKCECGRKLAMIDNDHEIQGVYVKCTACKREVEINNVKCRKSEPSSAMLREVRTQSHLVTRAN